MRNKKPFPKPIKGFALFAIFNCRRIIPTTIILPLITITMTEKVIALHD